MDLWQQTCVEQRLVQWTIWREQEGIPGACLSRAARQGRPRHAAVSVVCHLGVVIQHQLSSIFAACCSHIVRDGQANGLIERAHRKGAVLRLGCSRPRPCGEQSHGPCDGRGTALHVRSTILH